MQMWLFSCFGRFLPFFCINTIVFFGKAVIKDFFVGKCCCIVSWGMMTRIAKLQLDGLLEMLSDHTVLDNVTRVKRSSAAHICVRLSSITWAGTNEMTGSFHKYLRMFIVLFSTLSWHFMSTICRVMPTKFQFPNKAWVKHWATAFLFHRNSSFPRQFATTMWMPSVRILYMYASILRHQCLKLLLNKWHIPTIVTMAWTGTLSQRTLPSHSKM